MFELYPAEQRGSLGAPTGLSNEDAGDPPRGGNA
jgi:hypothetical protein